jgi:hypothetical protein
MNFRKPSCGQDGHKASVHGLGVPGPLTVQAHLFSNHNKYTNIGQRVYDSNNEKIATWNATTLKKTMLWNFI